jgi:hypothetical protein
MSALILLGAALGSLSVSAASGPDPHATNAQRAQAARKTAANNPLCAYDVLSSFYWEIGDATGMLASGRVGGRINANSVMNVGSASKWLYSSYVVEKQGDVPADVPFLTFTSGYSNFDSTQCPNNGTVGDCYPGDQNLDEAANHVFHYDGGHMQQHAISIGLGPLKNRQLATEILTAVGTELAIQYTKPQLAGGAQTNAANYAMFLRKLLVDSHSPLAMGGLLGSHAVCTFPGPDCNASSDVSVPESWHYSLGHWVEDDPTTTPPMNFAYSSPGLFGFYPWVDTDRKLYGILARASANLVDQNAGYVSAQCGRQIRLAWKTAKPQ